MKEIKILKRKIKTAQKLASKNIVKLYSKLSNQLMYGVTVIVPFYNAGKTLIDTCESLLKQKGISEISLEVLLIDNNSSDESTEIAKKYVNENPKIFKYLLCKEQGVSNARNLGLEKAKSKFITFLDADDTFSQTVIRDGFKFFSNHSDEIEIVFFPRFFMYVDENDNKSYKPHHRNGLFRNTGIYDESKNNYALYFTSPNIMIKNNQPYRFKKDVAYGEDMLFITNFLALKDKVGFVESAHYNYRFSEYSTVDKYLSPTNSANLILDNMSQQFEPYIKNDLPIPKQIQSMAFNEIAWRYKSLGNKLFPFHFDKIEYRAWELKLRNLLRLIDDQIILNYPNLDNFHKYSIILMKEEPIKLAIFDSLDFRKNGIKIHEEKEFETIISDFKISDGKLIVLGFLKVKLGELYQAEAYASINGYEMELDTWQSVSSLYNKRERSNDFTAFKFEYDLKELHENEEVEVYFYYKVNNKVFIPKRYWHSKNRILDVNRKSITYKDSTEILAENTVGGVTIQLLSNFHLLLTLVDKETQKINFEKRTQNSSNKVKELRDSLKLSSLNFRNVWLYVDNYNLIDNGFYQYMNDFQKNDNVNRYYVYKSDFLYVHEFISREAINSNNMKFVKYGSGEHKLLMIKTQYILGSVNEFEDLIVPFDSKEMLELSDVLNFKYVYLQHGVLHSKQPQTYDIERTYFDKIVISSDYEREVFKKELHYSDDFLLQVGMSRFDMIKKPKTKNKKILFAPSFRHTFVGNLNEFDVNGNRKIDKDQFFNSSYYHSIVDIIKSKELNEYLESNDLTLDIKLHPIFKGVINFISTLFEENQRMNIIDYQVNSNEYLIFVTDFSSYVFDAVYMQQPIIYYELDRAEFVCGNHHYRELYLDFEFGDVVDNVFNFIKSIDKIRSNEYKPEISYLEKMTSFYNFPENARESLYQELRSIEV